MSIRSWLRERIGTRYMKIKALENNLEMHESMCILCRDGSEMKHAPECYIAKGMLKNIKQLRDSIGVN